MASKKTRSTGETTKTTASAPKQDSPRTGESLPSEDYVKVWSNFAKEIGDTTTDFVKRFGEEQQKSYEQWIASTQAQGTPRPTADDLQEVTSRFEEWNTLAQEIGKKVADAFKAGTDLQKEFLGSWTDSQPSLPHVPTDTLREFNDLAEKFWTGLAGSLYQKSLSSLGPQVRFDDFVRTQEDSLKELTENFKKLTYSYFTSPPFVTLFGKTLDSSLEAQKLLLEKGGPLTYLSSIPTKKDLAQIQETLVELSNKVDRLQDKI